jgi:hypothetical protein
MVLPGALFSNRVWRTRFRLLPNGAIAIVQGAALWRVDRARLQGRCNALKVRAVQFGSGSSSAAEYC